MVDRVLAYGCWLFALGLLAALAYSHIAAAPWQAKEAVEATTSVEVPECVVGHKREVVLHLHNKRSVPVRVLGMSGC